MEHLFQELVQQLRATWRRRWWILPVAWLVCVLGWAYIFTLPDTYQVSSRVYVNTQSILTPLLRGMTVRPDVEQRIRMMTTTLLSNSNLQQIARKADLDVLADTGSTGELVEMLRKGIELSGESNNIYTISFQHENPEIAYRVVRETGDLFMERGLGSSRLDLVSSQQFIERQLERYEEKLRAKEKEIERFKQENSAYLSGEGSFYDRLERTRQRLEQARLKRKEARQRVQSLRSQLEEGDSAESRVAAYSNPQLEERINRLKTQLDQLRRRYTEQHPDVAQTQRILKELRAQLEREAQEYAENPDAVAPGDSPLHMALSEARSQVAALQTRVEEYRSRVERLEKAIGRVPQVESEYTALTRNYEALKDSYRRLLEKHEQAVLSGHVESETSSVDFRVLEPPQRPEEPAAPNRVGLASAVLVLGLGTGSGLAFLLAQIRGTLVGMSQLAELTGRPVLGQVSRVRTPVHRRRRRMEMLVFFSTIAALLVVYAAVMAVFFWI